MGRKPLPQPSKAVQAMDTAVERYEEQQLSIQQTEEMYGDGQPYERLRLQNEVRFYQDQAGGALIEMGKRLIRIKANEAHGGFLQVLDELGIAERSARYAMAAARKFGNRPALADLDSSKMKALTVLDDDSLQSLEDGERAAGVTLDEIDRMSVREALRAEREKRKKEKQAREDAISKKEEQINELEHKLRYQEPPTREQLAQVRLDELRRQFLIPINCVSEYYREAIAILDEAQRIEGITIPQLEAFVEHFSEELAILEGLRVDYEETVDNIRPQSNAGAEG
jgi:DNA-directed RNA polymerase